MAKDRETVAKKSKKATGKTTGIAKTPIHSVPGAHKTAVTALAFAPDGQTFVSGGTDTKVCLWDATSGRRFASGVMNMATWGITEVVFSPDGPMVAVVCRGTNKPVDYHSKAFLWNLIKRQTIEVDLGKDDNWSLRSPTFSGPAATSLHFFIKVFACIEPPPASVSVSSIRV